MPSDAENGILITRKKRIGKVKLKSSALPTSDSNQILPSMPFDNPFRYCQPDSSAGILISLCSSEDNKNSVIIFAYQSLYRIFDWELPFISQYLLLIYEFFGSSSPWNFIALSIRFWNNLTNCPSAAITIGSRHFTISAWVSSTRVVNSFGQCPRQSYSPPVRAVFRE